MPSWKGKTRGNLLGYKIFVFVLGKLGLKAAYHLLKLVAAYFVLFARKPTKSIYRYFRDIHKYSRLKSILSAYKNFYRLGQTLIDKVAIMAELESGFDYTCDGKEHLISLKEDKRGGMLISAHLGNWDIAGFMLNEIDLNINVVMFEAEHEKIKEYMGNVLKKNNVNVIPIKQDLSHIIRINKALKDNEIICIHGDRFVEGSRVVKKKFMGKDAYFPLGPFLIASKLKVPFTFVYALKDGDRHYMLSATPIAESGTDPEKILDEYIASLEKKLNQYPLQWFNYYDFWSNQAEGAIIE